LTAWLLYAPALNRVFVADQLWYFAERGGDTSLGSGLRHVDYAATRQYWKGDDALFRPALFVWLAVATATFSYHHVWWNVANLALHVLVAWCLLRLLLVIRPSPLAVGVSLVFVAATPAVDLVTWSHLGGYLIAYAAFLAGLRVFVGRLTGETPTWRSDLTYVAAFTLGGLSHELMLWAAILTGTLIAWHSLRRGQRLSLRLTSVIAAPLLIYAVLYAGHLQRVERPEFVSRRDAAGPFSAGAIVQAVGPGLGAVWTWAAETAQPSALRLSTTIYTRAIKTLDASWRSGWRLVDVGLAAAVLIMVALTTSARQLRGLGPLLIVGAGVLWGHAVMIAVGRGPDEFAVSAYYLYLPSLVFAILVYAAIDGSRVTGWMRPGTVIVLGGLLLTHGRATLATTRGIGRVNEAASVYLSSVARFVDTHRHEPDFTFTIPVVALNLDDPIDLFVGYPDNPARPMQTPRVTEILFARYYRAEGARYTYEYR
jgi:hypothetical protein